MRIVIKWVTKVLLTLLAIAVVWMGFFVLPNPARLPNPLWQLSRGHYDGGRRMWVSQRLLDAGTDVRVNYPPMEAVLKTAANLPGVGWTGMRDRKVAAKLACAWVGRGHLKELIDCRPAFLAPAGTTVDWRVDAADGVILKTALTVLSMPGDPRRDTLEYRITSVPQQGSGIVLFDSALTPEDPSSYPRSWWYNNFGKYLSIEPMADRSYWKEVRVDLPSELSGQGTIRFETMGSSSGAFPFWAEPRLLSPEPPIADSLPDIVFFLTDAVQARLLEDSTICRTVAPNLTMLKESGTYFRNAITNGTWKRPSMYSLFSSRPHLELGTPMVAHSITPVEQAVYYRTVTHDLVTELKEAGYTTIMLGNNLFLHSATSVGMDIGFDQSWDVERDYYDTVDITEMAIRHLRANPRESLFLFVNYNAPHYSYKPPPRYTRKVFGKDHGDVRLLYNQYLGEVQYADEYLGRVVRALDMLGRRNETLIVACADHGEVTRHHPVIKKCADLVSRGSKMVYQHGRSFFDDELRVPLIFSWQGRLAAGHDVREQVQLMDVTPTILDLTVGSSPQEFEGHSLVPLMEGDGEGSPVVFSESRNGISMRVENHWKYARRFPGFKAVWVQTPNGRRVVDLPEELYDLTSDPLEISNLADAGGSILDSMRALFDARVPDPVWVYRIMIPDSQAVTGEVQIKHIPSLTGSIGDVDYSLQGAMLSFHSSGTRGGEVYWIAEPDSDGGMLSAPVIQGAPVEWGPYALAGSWSEFGEWAGMVPAEVVPKQRAVWFRKNALEMWIAAGSGREPIVGGVREILQDWGYIR